MQDLTKSLVRFSWAMSMFGIRQAANLVTPRAGWDRSTGALDGISHSVEGHMGDFLARAYRTGDRLQSGVVDGAADLARGTWSRGSVMDQAWDAIDRSWSTLRDGMSGRAES